MHSTPEIASLRISFVQYDIDWENKTQNLATLTHLMSPLKGASDIIVLPEMFSTGFSMNAQQLAEPTRGATLRWMQEQAQELDAVVTGSVITEENGEYFNRLYWVEPNASFSSYDKKHLFSFANEEAHYSAGSERLIVQYKGWKICPLICYDLRFPVWSRNTSASQDEMELAYDLLIYAANWPEARRQPWRNLLEARAHENQAYVVGVNRVGKDGNGIPHSGDSLCFSPKGEILSEAQPFETAVATTELSFTKLQEFRLKFTAWKDWDNFRLKR